MISSSLFDDEESSRQNNGFWQTEMRAFKVKESKFKSNPQKYFRGTLFKREKKSGEYKALIFMLIGNRLSFMKRDSEAGYILLENHTLDPFENKDSTSFPYGLRLAKNRRYAEFFSNSKENRDEWISRLQKYCVLNNFFNDFNAVSVLGKGNFAKVYRVTSKATEKEYAAKIFEKQEVQKTPKFQKTILTEIKIMRMLEHPYILNMHKVYEGEQHIYLVFDLMKGKEMFERVLQRKCYSEKNAGIVLKKLIETMKYLQKKGVIHRDIKLENILLESEDDDCSIRLADFGLSMLMSEYDPKVRCGTPGYVAPEILKNQHYEYKSDIFSLGVVLFILLSGSAPFPGKTFEEIISKNKKCELKFNPKYWEKISPEAIDLVNEMMAPLPEDRPTWERVLENEWLKRMTDDEGYDHMLQGVDLDDSSDYVDLDRESSESENIKDDDMYEKEWYHETPIKEENSQDSQSFNQSLTLPEDKLNIRSRSGEPTRFNEKSFDKKHSINILAATDGSRSGSPLRRQGTTKTNGHSKFKDSAGGLEQGMPSMNIPFKNNVFSNAQLNSFYRRATMMKSFNRGNTLFSAFQNKEDSPGKQERKSTAPDTDFLRKKTVANDERLELNAGALESLKKNHAPSNPEELTTALIGEFYLQAMTISDKICLLNSKTYTFSPSKCFRRKK